ncbi:SGNH/GDSL hydrolase family protein [Zavarzinella formosa]|uniref:SGNH/GDSL hydrolase family protein n=1 Tax=Zavarzinella formosa TaxID=360055 RepID=UPI000A07B046|nr:SGNH/GDSL hydrolase family protein [Zavarzinella formosa]
MFRSVLLLAAIFAASPATAAEPESSRVIRESIEWLDVWVPGNNTKDIPKVLLIGDSITRAYYKDVEDRLKGKAVVCRLATSKSLGDPGLVAEVKLVLGQATFDVIHFNNGMHGWGYSEGEYARALPQMLDVLRQGAPKAKLVLASTTPVRTDKGDILAEKTDRVRVRNKAVAELGAAEKIPVNDLFGVVIDKPELFTKDGVHLNAKGSEALGKQVAETIASLLK